MIHLFLKLWSKKTNWIKFALISAFKRFEVKYPKVCHWLLLELGRWRGDGVTSHEICKFTASNMNAKLYSASGKWQSAQTCLSKQVKPTYCVFALYSLLIFFKRTVWFSLNWLVWIICDCFYWTNTTSTIMSLQRSSNVKPIKW